MKQVAKLKKIALSVLIVSSVFILSACSLTNNTPDPGLDSSVFLSTDGGNIWREAVALSTPGELRTIKNVNVNTLVFDPQDNMAVYLASRNDGLYYTYNITGEGWQKAKGLPNDTINDVRVDYRNKCLIYAAIGNRLYKSTDCSRSFSQIYFDNNTEVTVNSIALDFYNPQNIYIGTSRGEVIKSIDQGNSWRTIHRLDNEGVSQLILSPQDSRLIFVASTTNKIFSFNVNSVIDSNDPISLERSFAVSNFNDLNPVLKDYDLGRTFRDFVVSADGKLFIATNQTILRSPDNGITWEKLKLIPTDKDAVINSLAVDANNSDNIFYVTNTAFFRSTDGGVTWTTRKLPTSRAGSALLVDFKNPNNIYLGTVKLK